jgi:tRNA(Ile)-lysidine synthase
VIATVADTLRRRALCRADDRVVIALSGGADSVALVLALRTLEGRGGPALAGLVHVNHGLRGADSDDDEGFCRALAHRLGLPLEVHHADVAARARDRRCSIEVAARDARYACFPIAAAALGANLVATAHTRDDQAETVLLRLLRGTALRGAAGIPPKRGIYVRPLIDVRRVDVRAFLRAREEYWREDRSNADLAIPRNQLRHEVIPRLEELSASALAAIARFADLAADDEAALDDIATEMMADLVLSDENGAPAAPTDGAAPPAVRTILVDAARLDRTPPAVARRVVRRMVALLAPSVTWAADHIEAVRALAVADTSDSAADLPGIRVERTGTAVRISRAPTATGDWSPLFRRTLDIPGTVSIPEAGVVISARMDVAGEPPRGGGGARAVLERASVTPPLIVRNWRPGDRMRPLGAPGRRKLQDLFVDRKIPRGQRHRVPVVEDAAGRILWVAGVAVAESGRVWTPEASVVILEMRKDQ